MKCLLIILLLLNAAYLAWKMDRETRQYMNYKNSAFRISSTTN